jgi:hypothetical protein
MDILQSIIIQAIVFIVGLVLLFMFKNYYPKYFETKGANQATKEDIGAITEIVEGIKSDLLKRTEELKAQLSLTNQHRLNIKTAERDAVFDYNKKLSAWLYYLVRFSLSSYSLENYKELKQEEQEFSKRQYECDIAESHLTLFMNDKEFLETKGNLTISVLKYEGILSKAMQEIYYLHSKCEIDIQIADPKDKPAIRGRIYGDIAPVLEKYRSDTLKHYEHVHGQDVKFRKLIYSRIKKIIEESNE